ncbi:MAG: hypothetical protein JOZ31_24085 [Verrucomicrobia bacterium]|nr:hypothetical protein [Verrucomicrobiota bacterium]
MKTSKQIILLIGFLVTTTAPAFSQEALGVNYNQFLTSINEQELNQVDATWIRGFIEMHLLGNQDPSQNANVQAILKAKAKGHRTILNLKWNYETEPFPLPGSAAMNKELDQLHELLPVLAGKVDILVIGNEPFIETEPSQSEQPLIGFYRAMADDVIAYWKSHRNSTQLYMGAFTRLDLPQNRTAAVKWMLQYIASHAELSGADQHMHMPSFAACQTMLAYVLPWLRPDQKFLVTEFSLVVLWAQHLKDNLSADFTSRYNLPTPLKVYQFINLALQNPVPDAEWQDFLVSCPWYMAHRQFLLNADHLFRGTGRLGVATYAMIQSWTKGQPFTADTTPWLLNALFATETVQPDENGGAVKNFPWAKEFENLQIAY